MVLVLDWKINYFKNCGRDKYNEITDTQKNNLKNDITTYKNYMSEQKDIARKSFKCTAMEYYSDTGRVKYMEFTET